jgi:hypothetical protein
VLADSYRDLLSGAADLYLSTVANRPGRDQQAAGDHHHDLPAADVPDRLRRTELLVPDQPPARHNLSFVVFGLGLPLVSIPGFVIYFRRKRWM